MLQKPINIIGWNPPSEKIIEPSINQKNTGFAQNQKPPYQYFNYFLKVESDWIQYINESFGCFSKIHFTDVDYTIADADNVGIVLVDTGVSNINITLPNINNNINRRILVVKVDDGIGTVSLITSGSNSIVPDSPFIHKQYHSIEVVNDGINSWNILNKNLIPHPTVGDETKILKVSEDGNYYRLAEKFPNITPSDYLKTLKVNSTGDGYDLALIDFVQVVSPDVDNRLIIDLSLGNIIIANIDKHTILTFINITYPYYGRITLRQDLTGGFQVNFPNNVYWENGEIPQITTTPGSEAIVEIFTNNSDQIYLNLLINNAMYPINRGFVTEWNIETDNETISLPFYNYESIFANSNQWRPISGGGSGIVKDAIQFTNSLGETHFYISRKTGHRILRSLDGVKWEDVFALGSSVTDINCFCEFKDKLYVGVTYASSGSTLFRTDTGNSGEWESINITGLFGTVSAVEAMIVHNGVLYIAGRNGTTIDVLAYSFSGDVGSWWSSFSTTVTGAGLFSLEVIDNVVYVGGASGRIYDQFGVSYAPIAGAGNVFGLKTFNNKLYASCNLGVFDIMPIIGLTGPAELKFADSPRIFYDLITYNYLGEDRLFVIHSSSSNSWISYTSAIDDTIWTTYNMSNSFSGGITLRQFRDTLFAGGSFSGQFDDYRTDCTVYWGDGLYDTYLSARDFPTHTYSKAGIYEVEVVGRSPYWNFSHFTYSADDRLKITKVKFFGSPEYFAGFVSFVDSFMWCENLTSIGYYKISNNILKPDSFNRAFEGCINLTQIPGNLFDDIDFAASFYWCFRDCTALTNLPENFSLPAVTSNITRMFWNCSLTSIPENIFKKINITEAIGVFEGNKIVSIPEDLFRYNINITNFSSTFSQCDLLENIPSDLFRYNVNATYFDGTFQRCTSLQNIPSDLFRYNVNADNFSILFYSCTSLQNIPSDLFRYCVDATVFMGVFSGCSSLVSLPSDLFRYNEMAYNFMNAFNSCFNLESVPIGFFKYLTSNLVILTFRSTFENCTKLQLNSQIFCLTGEEATRFLDFETDFTDCFTRSSFTGNQGTAPSLWDYNYGIYTPSKLRCFSGLGNSLVSISNYNDIPVDWK